MLQFLVSFPFPYWEGFNSILVLCFSFIPVCFLLPGEYSCLRVDLTFKREFSYYLIQIYIPCCMLVIVSWVSFWLDPNAIPARVSLGVTTLLTMATQISGINASLPPVSYTKAIDVWYVKNLPFCTSHNLIKDDSQDWSMFDFCIRSVARVCACKLCLEN